MTLPSQRSAVKALGRALRSGTVSAWLAAILAGVLGSTVGFGRIEAATAAGGYATGPHRAGGSAVPTPLKAPGGGHSFPAQERHEPVPKEQPRPPRSPRPLGQPSSNNGRGKARPDQDQGAAEAAVPGAALAAVTRNKESTPSISNATESPMGVTAEPNGRRVGRARVSRSLESPPGPESPDTEEEAWMERWRAHKDEAAFAWFMARYWPCLLDYARCFVDWHDAQDIVQETFMYLWEKDPEVRSTSHLVALLRRVVHNFGLNRVHKTRRHVPMNSHALELILHTPAQDEQRGCRDDLLQAFIEALHTDDREILEWRYIEGAACSVIAARLGISLRGAHRKLAKSRQRLIDEAKRVQSP